MQDDSYILSKMFGGVEHEVWFSMVSPGQVMRERFVGGILDMGQLPPFSISVKEARKRWENLVRAGYTWTNTGEFPVAAVPGSEEFPPQRSTVMGTKAAVKKSKVEKVIRKPRAPKEGLRTPQMRILKALIKAGSMVSKARICELVAKEFPTAVKFQAWMADPLGSLDAAVRKVAEKKAGYDSLLTLKFVTTKVLDVDGKEERVYGITATGKKAYEKQLAAE